MRPLDDTAGRASRRSKIAAYLRRKAGSSAIAAILMCAYAFGALSAPEPKDLFTWCNWLFYYTLCIGGVAYGAVTVGFLMGRPVALAADGVLSLGVGGMFMVTGIGMYVDGGGLLNSVLITVFGWLFAGTGVRDLRVYAALRRELEGAEFARQTVPPPSIAEGVVAESALDVNHADESSSALEGGYLARLAREDRPRGA